MRGRGTLLALILFALCPLALAQQGQTCVYENQYGRFTYPCGSGESPAAEPKADESWWTSAAAQMALGIVGIVGSASAGAYTIYRVRTRRRTLTVTLAAIERAYVEAKSDPASGMSRLSELRADLRMQHEKGRLEDAQFLELDRRATQYLVKLRLLEVDRRFAMLPPLLLAEIRRLLGDGVLTPAEADLIEVRANAYRVPEHLRAELADLTRRWANEDHAGAPAPSATVAP